MSAGVTQHCADRPRVDACRNRYFACVHLCFGKHPPEPLLRASERSGGPSEGFLEFAFFERLAFLRSGESGLVTGGEW